jgi:hypothetical protein
VFKIELKYSGRGFLGQEVTGMTEDELADKTAEQIIQEAIEQAYKQGKFNEHILAITDIIKRDVKKKLEDARQEKNDIFAKTRDETVFQKYTQLGELIRDTENNINRTPSKCIKELARQVHVGI